MINENGGHAKIRHFKSEPVPDQLPLAMHVKAPELGPKILFFSGGTALNPLSKALIKYTHNSIHLITPFDSGGSSAILRKAFDMPAFGDMRSRLMALADQTVKGNPEVYKLFTNRLPTDKNNMELRSKLESMAAGDHFLVASVQDPIRRIICNHLDFFIRKMPSDFDLRGASIGNLILASGYLANDRHIDPVIFTFSKLAGVRGTVRPIMNIFLHLIARLEDGTVVKGQHMITGKESRPIEARVADIYLSKSLEDPAPYYPRIQNEIKDLILDAELICYPMGSFYSSIIANILPEGVGSAIAAKDCFKVYIPNTGHDPEQKGTKLEERVEILIRYLRKSCAEPEPVSKLLNFVVMDNDHSIYQGGVDIQRITNLGVKILEMPLTCKNQKPPYLDKQLLVEAILSMV